MLAQWTAHTLNNPNAVEPPLNGLNYLLEGAHHLIHFITVGIDAEFVETLKTHAERVPVSGIVYGLKDEDAVAEQLTQLTAELPNFTVLVADAEHVMPAEGLLVLDGLAALTGEMSLVKAQWEAPEETRDIVRATEDVREAMKWNNIMLSRVWKKLSEVEEVDMEWA